MLVYNKLMDTSDILMYGLRFLLIIPAIVLHEMAHGYAALWCGDDTAKRAGRLTLNPAAHIDLFGTILLPIMLLLGSGGRFAFGYAKPVPINPYNFKNQREGMMLTGIAGPAANLVLAIIAGLLIRLLTLVPWMMSGVGSIIMLALAFFCQINLVLIFFNLIPIPPLDGSRVLQRFLPHRWRAQYHRLERYGFFIIIGLLFLPSFIGIDIIGTYFAWTVTPIFRLLTGF